MKKLTNKTTNSINKFLKHLFNIEHSKGNIFNIDVNCFENAKFIYKIDYASRKAETLFSKYIETYYNSEDIKTILKCYENHQKNNDIERVQIVRKIGKGNLYLVRNKDYYYVMNGDDEFKKDDIVDVFLKKEDDVFYLTYSKKTLFLRKIKHIMQGHFINKNILYVSKYNDDNIIVAIIENLDMKEQYKIYTDLREQGFEYVFVCSFNKDKNIYSLINDLNKQSFVNDFVYSIKEYNDKKKIILSYKWNDKTSLDYTKANHFLAFIAEGFGEIINWDVKISCRL